MPEATDVQVLDECKDAARLALAALIESYSTVPPEAALTGIWGGLTDPGASRSIVAHIRRAVEEGETNVAVSGVSLRYSINVITEAINSLAYGQGGTQSLKGPLNIELIHVDDQSHILRSLEDMIDISSIVDYFRVRWPDTKAEWEATGRAAGIEVRIKDPAAIDYIPQQVGVRIQSTEGQWSVLYAGTCSFLKADQSTRLLVGEREYAFYTSSSPNPYAPATRNFRGPEAIEVFNQYVQHYGDPKHNGLSLVEDRYEWIQRLERCITDYQDIGELILVSNTCQKLFPLIVPALSRGIAVRAYTTHPDLLPPFEADQVRRLRQRLDQEKGRRLRKRDSGTAELLYLRHTPTFRAALIGEAVLGFESYVVPPSIEESTKGQPLTPTSLASETLAPSGLRLIVTRHSAHFETLREMLEAQCYDADAEL
jgi:hypothetical protein